MGIERALSQVAESLVLATAHGAASSPAVGDAAVICDIDLLILGAPRRTYDDYERAVRREYSFLADAEWQEGRRKVLEGFLQRKQIYTTGWFRGRFEARARENLSRALGQLTLPGGASPASPPAH